MSENQSPYERQPQDSTTMRTDPLDIKKVDEYASIPVTLVDRPAKSIRMSIDMEYIRELSESIKEEGLLQPILVYRKGERYGIIAGDCRFLAISRLAWSHIPAIIKDVSEEQIHIQRATENILRHDMTPVEEARTYRDLIDNFKITLEYIATKTGKTPGLIKRRLDILKMPERLIDAIHLGKIGYSIAEILTMIKDPTALNYYLDFAIENGITAEVAKQWVKDWQDAKRRAESDVPSIESLPPAMQSKPTFYACDTCNNPVDILKIQALRTCPDCFRLIRANLMDEN